MSPPPPIAAVIIGILVVCAALYATFGMMRWAADPTRARAETDDQFE